MGQVKVPGMRASAVGCGGNNGRGGAQVSWAWSQVLGFQAWLPFLNTTRWHRPGQPQGGKEWGFQLTLEAGRPHLPNEGEFFESQGCVPFLL